MNQRDDDDEGGATIISLRGVQFNREAEAQLLARSPDMIFRASLASVLTMDDASSRQDLLDAVRDHVKRRGELRHALEVVGELLTAGDVDGARKHIMEILEVGRG